MDNKKLTLAMFAYNEKGMLNPMTRAVKAKLVDSLDLDISYMEYAIFEGTGDTLYIIKVGMEEYKKVKMLIDEKIKMKVDDYYLVLSNATEELETMMAIIGQSEEKEYY